MRPTTHQVEKWCDYQASGILKDGGAAFENHIGLYEDAFGVKANPPFFPLWYPHRMGEMRFRTTTSHDVLSAFFPNAAWIRTTNLYQAISELIAIEPSFSPYWRAHDGNRENAYEPLHRWSVEQRSHFWRYVVTQRLKLPFRCPPDTILAFPKGDITQPLWLGGAVWNICDFLFRHSSDQTALIYEREDEEVQHHWTYGQLLREIQTVAGALHALGLGPGDRIALCMPLRPEAVFLYLGALYAGVSVATIPDSLSGEEIAARLRIAAPKLLFIQDGLYREGKYIPLYDRLRAFELPRTFVIAGRETIQTRLRNNASAWAHFLAQGSPLNAPHYTSSDHEIGVLFSSGTTAEPKAIPWTQLTAIKAIADAHFYHDLHSEDIITWPTNLGWMMGPWLLLAGLGHGAAIALYEGAPTSASYCRFIERQKVTILGVVPSLVRRWIESDAWEGVDWSHIRLFSSTGEASNPWHMWRLMAKAGYKPIIEYCGGTEIGGGYITSTLLHPNAPSQFSAPALGLDFILLDEKAMPSVEGELFLVPPSIGLSQSLLNADHHKVYYEGVPRVQEGWIGASGAPVPKEYAGVPMHLRRHGDYMRRLDSGYWVSGGRSDDAMNLGGIKVSAAEIERVVAQLPAVGEAAAIAVPPPEGGPEQLVLYVVPRAGIILSPQEIYKQAAQAIREKLSPLFHLHEVVIVEDLPRTASNKVMRRFLRAQYVQQRGS
ncbi:MAG: AMP-binding protein [Bacteroidia bacterium]|nr:AMP-binding protein [Bacteroidia bacterium]